MEIDFNELTAYERYKLMAGLIVPRPIALVTTLSPGGVINAAPFSMFNMLGEEPPIVMLSVNRRDDDSLKDTAANILREHEFVVHLTDEPIAAKMHACGERLPASESELAHAGFMPVPSTRGGPPRIAEAPVAFECTLWETLETPSRHIFIGRVERLHARDDLIDRERCRVHLQHYYPVGRFGASFYVDTRNRFSLDMQDGTATVHTVLDEM